MVIEVYIGKTLRLTSFDVLKDFQRLIKQNHLENKVSLSASLCVGDFAQSGVPVKIGEAFTDFVSKDNLEHVFGKYVLQAVGSC
ncbi:(2Fe-2S) ferredoxin domain-containing protein [Caproiciproducens faecalis]|uniref:(2Fe-2S) ferredoxin domain-containing protein n=1 Tax=Caproiciproducens faecalis TaxID=2820301 RepID=A0ABS7DLA5_9FIRM|nr:(2Fe-2S) ferredoxin domain-containing protein [Caproiciproducens faecalis]MBW7572079.1 (2Fe-2S) ferredoxin domain-containing protein [Caproiciproducens faecalis]